MKTSKSNPVYFSIFAIMVCLSASCSDSDNGNTFPASAETGEEAPVGEEAPTPPTACTILQAQVLSPTLQTEVPNGTQAELCDFNVMGW